MPVIVGLDMRTRLAMEQFFGGNTCVDCGAPAERYVGRRFRCHACLRDSAWGDRTPDFEMRPKVSGYDRRRVLGETG